MCQQLGNGVGGRLLHLRSGSNILKSIALDLGVCVWGGGGGAGGGALSPPPASDA